LLERAEFDAVLRGPDRISSRTVRAHFLRTHERARLGVVVAKRIAPRAVDRNRFKRHSREAFRAVQTELQGLDLVLVAKPEALTGSAAQLRGELDRILQQLAKLNRSDQAGTIAR
jgi:ribonuclease P protein component